MAHRLKYVKRPSQAVVAVQLALSTKGFTYTKWGATQRCKSHDWLVDNDGDVYTVDRVSFRRTYRRLRPGVYLKKSPVWAEVAGEPGRVTTKEGTTRYKPGDYLVFNHRNGADGYAVSATKFKRMYVRSR